MKNEKKTNFGTLSAFANNDEPSETTDSDQFINNYFGELQ